MKLPFVLRSDLSEVQANLSQCRRLSRYWYEECERSDQAYRRLELRLISLRGELEYERERRRRERLLGIMAAPE